MKLRYFRQVVGIVCLIGVIALTGCRKDKAAAPSDTAETETAKSDTATSETATSDTAATETAKSETVKADENPEVIAMLAKADLVDGTEDHVVHRCANCALGMDGDEKNALTVGKYQMHFCSADCLDGFAKDPSANILALVIPEQD